MPIFLDESDEFTELFSIDDADNLNTETLIPTPPPIELKPFPIELKYVLLDLDGSHPVIISYALDASQELDSLMSFDDIERPLARLWQTLKALSRLCVHTELTLR